MLLSTLIVMSAAAWSLGLALPILVTQEDTSRGNTPSKDARTIFEMIEKINRRIPKLLLEGDIALQISRNAQKCGGCIWPKSRSGIVNVPYVISSQFTNNQRAVFAAAMQEFATMTCVRFVSRTKEKDYLSIEPKDGCWSHVGRTGGKQTVSLSKAGCIHYGVAQHELTHSLGFYHEHTRRDRDDYIDIMWQNISPEYV
ncbi:hatching enzyme 1.2-like [Ascaphus truei]|uniref:hatching enzyme 1.2-like n=1 Tax=Ascaphus truei TaxID=8439 RepID=UPI003F5A0622